MSADNRIRRPADPETKAELKHALASYYDIRCDLIEIRDAATWVHDNYRRKSSIPLPQVDGRHVNLRSLYLDALLSLYRRCFHTGHRRGIHPSSVDEAIGGLREIHDDEIMKRANQVVAHAHHASRSTTLKIGSGKQLHFSVVRPSVNQLDFHNLGALAQAWLNFVEAEIARLTPKLLALVEDKDDDGDELFVVPWGAPFDIQGVRRKQP